jgi:hypothetical protein
MTSGEKRHKHLSCFPFYYLTKPSHRNEEFDNHKVVLWRDREIKEVLNKQVITGRVPQSVPIYAEFFSDKIPAGGSSADSRCPRCSPDVYGPAQKEMKAMFAIRDYSPSCSNNQSMLIWKGLVSSSTYEDDIQTAAEQMANGTFSRCASFADCSSCDLRQKMTVMSLGDELRVTPFRWIANETNGLFTAWLQQQGVSDPSTLGCPSWTACPYWSGPYPNASEMVKPGVPEQWYYSQVRSLSVSALLYSNWSCYQDRLGTNMIGLKGQQLKKRRLLAALHARRRYSAVQAGDGSFAQALAIGACGHESVSDHAADDLHIHWQPGSLDDTVLPRGLFGPALVRTKQPRHIVVLFSQRRKSPFVREFVYRSEDWIW